MIDGSIRTQFNQIHQSAGVTFDSRQQKYVVNISTHGKTKYYGNYPTLEEARSKMLDIRWKIFAENLASSEIQISDLYYIKKYNIFITKSGRVFNTMGNEYRVSTDRQGYVHFPHKGKAVYIHRLIAQYFVPQPFLPLLKSDKMIVNHIDGNKKNNNYENLEWVTYSQNTRHAYETGLEKISYGENHHAHKFTIQDIKFIREHYKKRDKNYSSGALGRMFNVDPSTIRDIVKRKTWKEVK